MVGILLMWLMALPARIGTLNWQLAWIIWRPVRCVACVGGEGETMTAFAEIEIMKSESQ